MAFPMNRLSATLIFIAAILLTPVFYLMSDPTRSSEDCSDSQRQGNSQ